MKIWEFNLNRHFLFEFKILEIELIHLETNLYFSQIFWTIKKKILIEKKKQKVSTIVFTNFLRNQ